MWGRGWDNEAWSHPAQGHRVSVTSGNSSGECCDPQEEAGWKTGLERADAVPLVQGPAGRAERGWPSDLATG